MAIGSDLFFFLRIFFDLFIIMVIASCVNVLAIQNLSVKIKFSACQCKQIKSAYI